jgi:hypothetical protein
MTRVSLQDLTNPTITAAKKVATPVKVRPTFWERPSYVKESEIGSWKGAAMARQYLDKVHISCDPRCHFPSTNVIEEGNILSKYSSKVGLSDFLRHSFTSVAKTCHSDKDAYQRSNTYP